MVLIVIRLASYTEQTEVSITKMFGKGGDLTHDIWHVRQGHHQKRHRVNQFL